MKAIYYVVEFDGGNDLEREVVDADSVTSRIEELSDMGERVINVYACVPVEFTVKRARTVATIIE